MKIIHSLLIPFKGFVIGSSMTVPGVSGGTMAILLGIYDRLIAAISHFGSDVKKNTLFLLKFCLGAVIGFLALASTIGWLLETFSIPTSCFFIGAIVGGIPALYRKASESKFSALSVLYMLIGAAVVLAIGFVRAPQPAEDAQMAAQALTWADVPLWLVSGLVISLALVLPGISTSHMLLLLGIYMPMTASIKHVFAWVKSLLGGQPVSGVMDDVLFLGMLALSTLIGVFLITRPLEWLMKKFPHQTYCVIIGFVVGSLADVFKEYILPEFAAGRTVGAWVLTAVVSVVTLIAGAAGILYLARFSEDE